MKKIMVLFFLSILLTAKTQTNAIINVLDKNGETINQIVDGNTTQLEITLSSLLHKKLTTLFYRMTSK